MVSIKHLCCTAVTAAASESDNKAYLCGLSSVLQIDVYLFSCSQGD